MPNLAVEADDWNYAMAMLRDSLEASRIAFVMATNPDIQLDSIGPQPVVLRLADPLTAGYVFVRRGAEALVMVSRLKKLHAIIEHLVDQTVGLVDAA